MTLAVDVISFVMVLRLVLSIGAWVFIKGSVLDGVQYLEY